jgi:hypothetical protein
MNQGHDHKVPVHKSTQATVGESHMLALRMDTLTGLQSKDMENTCITKAENPRPPHLPSHWWWGARGFKHHL